MRRLPTKSIRAMTACGFSDACCGVALPAVAAARVLEAALGECHEACKYREAPLSRICCAPACKIVAGGSSRAATQVRRPSKTPNGKQTFLCAAVEVLNAAPPNTSWFSPAEPGMGWLCVDPHRTRLTQRALCQIL